MDGIEWLRFSLLFLLIYFLMSGCAPTFHNEAPADIQPSAPSLTPTQCTGWHCTLEGVVFREEPLPDNEAAGLPVELTQISWCSPTAGDTQTITDPDGHFAFEVYLHDTDSFVISASAVGYQSARVKFGGFDCLYCACEPLEIVLLPE